MDTIMQPQIYLNSKGEKNHHNYNLDRREKYFQFIENDSFFWENQTLLTEK